jgi:drug/metabolite transporter (DMT)-like permease
MQRKTQVGLLFAFLAMAGYAFLPIYTKLIYRYSDLQGIDIAGWRFMTAMPVLWVLVYLHGRRSTHPTATERLPRVKLMLIGGVLAVGALSAFYGLARVDARIYTMVFRVLPLMVLIINAGLGERFPLRGWLALGVVMIGMMFVLEPGGLMATGVDINRSFMIGIGIALLNAFAIAIYNVGQQHIMQGFGAKMRASAWTTTGTIIAITPALLFMGLQSIPNWQTGGALLGLAITTTVLPTVALYEAIGRLGASRMVIVGSLEPVLAVLLAIVLLGEPMLTPFQMIGGVLIASSLFVLEGRREWFRTPKQRRLRRYQQAVASGD